MSGLGDQIRMLHFEQPHLTRSQIARLVGCTSATVTKALNPEKAAEWRRRDNLKRKDSKRHWEREWARSPEGRATCTGCGGPMGIGSAKHGGALCRGCVERRADARIARIADLYNAGYKLREIAAELGTSLNSIRRETFRARQRGLIGYRYKAYERKAAA
jgi:hypothetical protein